MCPPRIEIQTISKSSNKFQMFCTLSTLIHKAPGIQRQIQNTSNVSSETAIGPNTPVTR